jgi:sigma-B regulation protein RsbU (phosphoserine phosphatase)
VDDDRLGLTIGDVTDKGVPAAIFMARTHAFWRAEATRGDSPRAVLERVNSHLLETNEKGLFVTMIYGILNRQTGEFTYARAGHEAPLLCAPDGATRVVPFSVGEPLGVLPAPALDEQTVWVPASGLLVLYTDGLTEAWNEGRRQFGEARLIATLQRNANAGAQVVCDHLLRAGRPSRPDPQSDDVTLLAARFSSLKEKTSSWLDAILTCSSAFSRPRSAVIFIRSSRVGRWQSFTGGQLKLDRQPY